MLVTDQSLVGLSAYVGKRAATVARDGVSYHVDIMDVRKDYGQVRFLIRPVAGSGMKWADSSTLHLLDEPVAVTS